MSAKEPKAHLKKYINLCFFHCPQCSRGWLNSALIENSVWEDDSSCSLTLQKCKRFSLCASLQLVWHAYNAPGGGLCTHRLVWILERPFKKMSWKQRVEPKDRCVNSLGNGNYLLFYNTSWICTNCTGLREAALCNVKTRLRYITLTKPKIMVDILQHTLLVL